MLRNNCFEKGDQNEGGEVPAKIDRNEFIGSELTAADMWPALMDGGNATNAMPGVGHVSSCISALSGSSHSDNTKQKNEPQSSEIKAMSTTVERKEILEVVVPPVHSSNIGDTSKQTVHTSVEESESIVAASPGGTSLSENVHHNQTDGTRRQGGNDDALQPGAQRVAGINASSASPYRGSGEFSVGSADNPREDNLVEATLVKRRKLVRAEEMDRASQQRRIVILIVGLVIIGLATGVTIGVLVGSNGNSDGPAPIGIAGSNVSDIELFLLDFQSHSVSASMCFESTEKLISIVDAYMDLRAEVEARKKDYRLVRNNSVRRRDEIALLYGWPIGSFCVSKIESLRRIFSPQRGGVAFGSFNEDISQWDTGNVQSMEETFYGSQEFNQPLGKWNTSRVTNMVGTFRDCQLFDQDISTWDISRVTSLELMFRNANSFDQPIGEWNTSEVLSMSRMFEHSSSFNKDLSEWDVSKVEIMFSTFFSCSSFNQDLSAWTPRRVTDLRQMFRLASSYNQPSKCEWGETLIARPPGEIRVLESHIQQSFSGTACEAKTIPNIQQWPHTQICGDCMAYYREKFSTNLDETSILPSTEFQSTPELREAVDEYMEYRNRLSNDAANTDIRTLLSGKYGWPIGEWNVSLIEDFSRVFSVNRTTAVRFFNEDISGWDVSNGRSFSGMFEGAALFNQRLSQWNVSNAADMSLMFGGASTEAVEVDYVGAASFNTSISMWDVSRVRNMGFMFQGAISFAHDLSRWDTSNVESMEGMFAWTKSFNSSLPWNVSNVRSFGSMFRVSSFSGNISDWDTSRGKNFASMFYGASNFNQDLAGWDVSSATSMTYMFADSPFNNDISNWKPGNCLDFSGMFLSSSIHHSFCDWGWYIKKPGRATTLMFTFSYCPDPRDPQLDTDPVSPLCFPCD